MCEVSIIVPMYNGKMTISRCLDSLINQELKEIEILVINDGSTDDGEKIVENYVKQDSRIRLINQENQGQGAARNRGIKEARGKYIGFVDCDDFVSHKMFANMFRTLEKTNAEIAVCQEKNVYIEDEKICLINETRYPINEATVYSSTEVLNWLLNYTFLALNSMCYKVIRRELFLDYNILFPEKYRYSEDLVASVFVLSKAKNIVMLPESLYYYVHDRNSFTYSYSVGHARDVYLDWKDVIRCITDNKITGLYIDNFSLGMQFSSLKQLYWIADGHAKKSLQAKQVKENWDNIRKEQRWKPNFSMVQTPFVHKVKIYAAYFHLCRPMLALIRLLHWIPFFRYMS